MGQAKDYAERLNTRFALCTNGDKIYQVDMLTGKEGYLDRYPTPEELWTATYPSQNDWRDRFAAIPFEDKGGTWETRYYQHNAIEAVLEGIAKITNTEKSDIFDVLTYIAYATKPLTRQERVIKHKDSFFSKYTGKQQEFLDFVLDQYIQEGVGELDRKKLPQLLSLKYHNTNDAIAILGKIQTISEIFTNFQADLYSESSLVS